MIFKAMLLQKTKSKTKLLINQVPNVFEPHIINIILRFSDNLMSKNMEKV